MLPSPVAEELPTGGSGLGRYRGPVGETKLTRSRRSSQAWTSSPHVVSHSASEQCSRLFVRASETVDITVWALLAFLSGNLPTCHGITFSLPAAS
jgi:hypothetical protein